MNMESHTHAGDGLDYGKGCVTGNGKHTHTPKKKQKSTLDFKQKVRLLAMLVSKKIGHSSIINSHLNSVEVEKI